MPFSLANFCRTCLCNGANYEKNHKELNNKLRQKMSEMVPLTTIHKGDDSGTQLLDILRSIAPQLNLEANNELPKNICLKCEAKIKEIHTFQQNCLKVEKNLLKMVEMKDANGQSISYTALDIDEVFIDESFESEEFLNDDDSNDSLVVISDMDDFIESCSDMSIDFVIDDESESDLNISQPVQTEINNNSKTKQDPTPQDVFWCERCSKLFKSEVSLKNHMKTHRKKDNVEGKYVCHICGKAFAQAHMLREHLRSHSEKLYLCSECGKSLTTSSSLKQHLLRHTNEKQFTCPDCPKAFPTKTDLSSHYDVHKARPKNHICDICGRAFPKAFILKKHKMAHTSERPYPCEFCEKRFLTNEKVQRHTRIHTGEKPYKCKYCEKAYGQSNELTKHLRCHLGDNVYQCRLCPDRFPSAKVVKEHFKDHKNDDEETRARNLARLEAMDIIGIFCR